jgi:alkanesulfonate monooxygenase SsuD/methylene tetrahydromethanopterin reductase-like flavin-dependent oxidoreductase (luciferase family)
MPALGPYAAGGISVGIHAEAPTAGELIDRLVEQARVADASGYDGVSVAEHHGGFGGYVPSPIQVAGWLLPEMARGWAATGPLLLSLRNPLLVVEESAWLAARFQGRFGLGVGPGFAPLDFEGIGVPLEERLPRFRKALEAVVDGLAGRGPSGLAGDPAVAALRAGDVPVVATLGGPVGAQHAGRLGAGAMVDSFASVEKAAGLFERYAAAGGKGPRVLCRRCWLGPPDPERMAVLAKNFRSIGSTSAVGAPQTDFTSTDDPDELADRLTAELRGSGADALLLRFHFPGLAQEDILDQLEQTGREVLPRVRQGLGQAAEVRR